MAGVKRPREEPCSRELQQMEEKPDKSGTSWSNSTYVSRRRIPWGRAGAHRVSVHVGVALVRILHGGQSTIRAPIASPDPGSPSFGVT